MDRYRQRVLRSLATGLLLLGATVPGSAWSRNWKPASTALAQDYSLISDSRDSKDMKIIFWLSPPMVPEGKVRDMLEQYILIGVAHGHMAPTGVMSFDAIDTLDLADHDGQPLHPLNGDEIPPSVAGTVSTMTSVMSQSLGPFGKGIHWFVFESSSIHACADGGFSVPFANETYTYQTPIPGCPPS